MCHKYGLNLTTPIACSLLAIALFVAGCGGQRGQFVSSGVKSSAFSTTTGYIEIVRGNRATAFGRTEGPEQNLLYLIIICPDVQVRGSQERVSHDTYATELSHVWTTEAGNVSVRVLWDRRRDEVRIAGARFSRKKGNVFLVRRQQNGDFAGQQLAELNPTADFEDVLRLARKQNQNDKLLAELQLR
jgi:hypothetical protein